MSLRETREETEARLIAAHEQRVQDEQREIVRNGSDADYSTHKARMLKTARETARGNPEQRDTSDVRELTHAEYETRKRDYLSSTRR